MTDRRNRANFTITISDKERCVLETVASIGACTFSEVHEKLDDGTDLLTVMRRMHVLVDRGLLKRVTSRKRTYYRVKSNYKALIRTHVMVAQR